MRLLIPFSNKIFMFECFAGDLDVKTKIFLCCFCNIFYEKLSRLKCQEILCLSFLDFSNLIFKSCLKDLFTECATRLSCYVRLHFRCKSGIFIFQHLFLNTIVAVLSVLLMLFMFKSSVWNYQKSTVFAFIRTILN